MIRIAFSVDIARPPAEVFAYLTDPATLPEWMPSKRSASPDPPGPLRIAAPLLRRAVERNLRRAYAELRRRLEAGAATSTPAR